MKKYSYSRARQHFAEVLDTARTEDVLITRRGGENFRVSRTTTTESPFDVPGIETKATTADILDAVNESRRRDG